MEIGSSFGLTYRQEKSNDWNCLNRFLECLQNSQGEKVYLGVNEREETKIPEEYKELILNWTERGYKKPEEKKTNTGNGGLGGNNIHNFNDGKDWSNISSDFANNEEGQGYKRRWIRAGFTYQSCKEWIDIGLKANNADFAFAAWLREKKKITPNQVLNHGITLHTTSFSIAKIIKAMVKILS